MKNYGSNRIISNYSLLNNLIIKTFIEAAFSRKS